MVDPTAEVACTLPINEADDRLKVLETLVAGRLATAERNGDRLRICLDRDGDADLDAKVSEWATRPRRAAAPSSGSRWSRTPRP